MQSWKYARAGLKPRECRSCHEQFKPTNSVQWWCNKCAPNQFFRQRLSTYGIGKPQFDMILKAQKGRCSICEREFNPEHIPGEDHVFNL
jgi:hypothetical protein